MPTPEPIATPVPVNAQRERIESDAYIAVEELIFFSITLVSFFFLCVINERETRERERERERMKRIHSSAPKTFVVYIILFENVSTRPCVLPSRCTDANATFARFRRRRARGVARVASSIGFPLSFRGDSFLFFLLAHLYSPLSFSWSKTNASKKKKSSSSNGDASRPSHRAGPSRFERAEYILPRRTNNKNRRRTQTTTTTTHSFFCLRVCV